MRRFSLVLALLVTTVVYATAASADPSHNVNPPLPFSCDNGENVLVNPGTVTNQSRQAFVIRSDGTISDTSILVVKFLALSDGTDTLVLLSIAQGVQDQGLVTCTTDLGGGIEFIVRGFFTPRT